MHGAAQRGNDETKEVVPVKTKRGSILLKAALLSALIMATAAASEAVELRDGEWETVTEMVMEGMPFALPPTTVTQCISQKDPIPKGEKDKNCTVEEPKVKGNTVAWRFVCKDDQGTSDGTGEITYSGDTYKGGMKMAMTDKKGAVTRMTMKMSGRRLGPCTGKGPTVNGRSQEDLQRQMRETEQAIKAAEEERRAQRKAEEAERRKERDAAAKAEQAAAAQSADPETAAAKGSDPEAPGKDPAPDKTAKAIDESVKSLKKLFKW